MVKKTVQKKKSQTGKIKQSTAAKIKKSPSAKIKKPVVSAKSKKTSASSKRKPKVAAIPKGYHSITPYLIVKNATNAIEFYKKAFGAKVVMKMEHPSGKIGHAELQIGDAKIMLADEHPDKDARAPQSFGGSPVSIHLYIKDVDAIVKKSIAAGAKLIRPVENMFYGDRTGMLEDPYGHKWCISTHIEDVSMAQLKKRAAEIYAKV